MSPAVITIKKDKSVKIALDSRKLNEACVKRKAAMPNMEEVISKISAEITKSNGEYWMSKIDLDYAYRQAKLSKEAAKHCVFSIIGGRFYRPLPIQEGFLWAFGYSNRISRTYRQSVRIQNTSMAGRYHLCNQRNNRQARARCMGSTQQITKRLIQSKRKENWTFQTRIDLAGLPHKPERGKTNKRQDGSNNQIESPKEP